VSTRADWIGRAGVIFGVAAGAWMLSAQLLVRPIVGLADNGDFVKVMRPAGLAYAEPGFAEFFLWAPDKFAFAEPKEAPDRYVTSETLLARLAVDGARLAGARLFDIRVLGALHAGLLLLGLGFLVAAARDLAPAARWTAAVALVLVFTDVAYAAPLNSIYGQASSLVFFLVTCGIAALGIRRGGLAGVWLPAYFVAAALFVGSKPQETLHAPLLAALGVGLACSHRRRRAAAIALGVVLTTLGFAYFKRTPLWHRRIVLYHAVFTELLPNSPDPVADLRRLGLPERYLSWSGTTAYEGSSLLHDPAFRMELDARVGYRVLGQLYLEQPLRAAGVVRRAASKGARMRPPFFGDLAKDAGAPPRAQSRRFALWSDLKLGLHPWTLPALGTAAGVAVLAALATWRRATTRGRLARAGVVVLAVMAAIEFLVCAFADAHIELVRHLYVFHAMIDLLLIAALVWAVQAVMDARAARRIPGPMTDSLERSFRERAPSGLPLSRRSARAAGR
jgi:MYXO-CTERM domain-containing protein